MLVKRGKTMNNDKPSFLRNHIDTLAIIGVNLAVAAILITLFVMNVNRIDSANIRIDGANVRSDQLHIMFYDLLKEVKK
jgi:hypothetical protein